MTATSTNLFSQLLLPLQGVVDFFSPPTHAASISGNVNGAQPRLAKAPALPSSPRPASAQAKIRPAGIRLVGSNLMGNMQAGLSAAQILRSRRAQDGRIVISGRMRDVCAELDRLCDEPA
jgi:hypothetical protein